MYKPYRYLQVPLNPNATDPSLGDDEYELAHMVSIDAANLTSLNASEIHVAVSKAGACSSLSRYTALYSARLVDVILLNAYNYLKTCGYRMS